MPLVKRNGYWHTRIKVDGEWVRQSTGCKSKGAAQAILEERERVANDPAYRAAHTTTLASMIETFLASGKRKAWAAGTRSMYDQKSRHLLRVIGAGTAAANVDATAVDSYCDARLSEGAHSNTIAKELATLRGTLKDAIRAGNYPHQLAQVMPDWDAGYVPRETYLTRPQLDALLAVLPPLRADYVRYAVATTGRHSELMAAREGDVDHVRGVVFMRSTKTKRKGYGDRHVPINPLTLDLLDGVTLPLQPWNDGNRQRDLAAACLRAGVPRVTSNDLRRTHATWLVQGGVDDGTAGRALGHASADMVRKIYGRMTPEALRDKLNAQLGRVPLAYHANGKQPPPAGPSGHQLQHAHAQHSCVVSKGSLCFSDLQGFSSVGRAADSKSAPASIFAEETRGKCGSRAISVPRIFGPPFASRGFSIPQSGAKFAEDPHETAPPVPPWYQAQMRAAGHKWVDISDAWRAEWRTFDRPGVLQ